jgi:hypothetical protein
MIDLNEGGSRGRPLHMRFGHGLRAALAAALLAACGLGSVDAAAQSTATCDGACLEGFIDGYIDALAKHDPSKLPLAPEHKYTENGRVLDLGEGFWHTAGAPLRYSDYILDPETGGAAVFTALKEYEGVAQMFLRLKVVDRKFAEIETFVVRVGDQRWFAPANLEHLSDVFAQTVPAAERHTRAQLVAAANAYFDAIQTEGTPEFKQAPFAPGMKRFENGLQTTNVTSNPIMERHTWSPDKQLERASYKGTMVMDRRFPIVDQEHGTVLAVGTFRREGPDTSTLLLAEMFKVTGGKLREIRAVILNLPNGAGTGWTAPR